jgi:hypothetical protein
VVDWALLWSWVDTMQGKICAQLTLAPDAFPLTTIEREKLIATPFFILIVPPEDPEPEG